MGTPKPVSLVASLPLKVSFFICLLAAALRLPLPCLRTAALRLLALLCRPAALRCWRVLALSLSLVICLLYWWVKEVFNRKEPTPE